jgi:hypothetical protein
MKSEINCKLPSTNKRMKESRKTYKVYDLVQARALLFNIQTYFILAS